MSSLQNIGPFIVVLGIIIFVHEFGHFITAKAFGMRVFIFSFGFGKRLIGWKRGDTDYRISLIPLGGYVKLEGEPEDHLSEDTTALGDGKDFTTRPRWQKFLVYLAGPFMNGVLTIGVLTALFLNGSGEVDATLFSPAVIGAVDAGSPAAGAGLVPGDEIVSIDGHPIQNWEDGFTAILIRPNANVSVGIRRGDVGRTVQVRSTAAGAERMGAIGVSPAIRVKPLAGMPAADAGLQPGDAVLAIDDKPVKSYPDLIDAVYNSQGKTLRIQLLRGAETLMVAITPRKTAEGFRIGLGLQTVFMKFGLGGAFAEACKTTWQQTKLTIDVVKRLLTAQLSPKILLGPIQIAEKSGEAAKGGIAAFFFLIAMISLQVGILNLFPLAPLDGGHLAIIAGEAVVRRDFSMDVKAWIMNAGALVMLGLILVVLYSDLSKTSFLSKYLH